MNDESVTDAERRIVRTNERVFGTLRDKRKTVECVVSFAVRLLTSLAVGVAVAWFVAFAVPAFSGLLTATVIGFGVLWLVPWFVVTGVVRVLEFID